MKYSIGDRVILKEDGNHGIIVECLYKNYMVYDINDGYVDEYPGCDLQTDLTAIEKPFGLLSKEVQEELKAVNNRGNMQFWYGGEGRWKDCGRTPIWNGQDSFRLDPNYTEPKVKEVTMQDLEEKYGCKVKIVKES